MILAYHIIYTTYGFWLPNDPRGSWSDYVASWEIFCFGGPAKKTTERHSLAHVQHDRARRIATKRQLKYPPVRFSGKQARCVAEGIGRAATEAGYLVLACSVMPDHVHIVLARHFRPIKQIVGHLKAKATMVLNDCGLHPLAEYRTPNGSVPKPWADGCWKVFLDSAADVLRAIKYVENNPVREGYKPQRWTFVRAYES